MATSTAPSGAMAGRPGSFIELMSLSSTRPTLVPGDSPPEATEVGRADPLAPLTDGHRDHRSPDRVRVRVRVSTSGLLAGRTRKVVAAAVVLVIVAAVLVLSRPASPPDSGVRTENETIAVPGGPGVSGPVDIDATLYLPAVTGRAPAVLMAHGFGGSKDSVASDARDLAGHGFVVLAYSARGFGQSTGQIALDSLDYEIPDARALVSWLATRPEVLLDAPGDPRVGVTGASYGGALSLMLAGTDKRIDAVAPLITWNDLSAALFPNAIDTRAESAGTPADATAAPDGVFKKSWAASLMASVISGTALTAGTAGTAPSDSGDSGFGRGTSSASAAPTGAPASAAPTADRAVRRRTGLRADDAGPVRGVLTGGTDRPGVAGPEGIARQVQPQGGRRRHHRPDPAGARRTGHAVRSRPVGRERQSHRRQGHHGRSHLVQRRSRRGQPGSGHQRSDQQLVRLLPCRVPEPSRPPPSATASTVRCPTPAGPAPERCRRRPTRDWPERLPLQSRRWNSPARSRRF